MAAIKKISKRHLTSLVVIEFFRSLGQRIPSILQILTSMAFLTLLTSNAELVNITTLVLFVLYWIAESKMMRREMFDRVIIQKNIDLDATLSEAERSSLISQSKLVLAICLSLVTILGNIVIALLSIGVTNHLHVK